MAYGSTLILRTEIAFVQRDQRIHRRQERAKTLGVDSAFFQPSFFSKTDRCFPVVFGGSLERSGSLGKVALDKWNPRILRYNSKGIPKSNPRVPPPSIFGEATLRKTDFSSGEGQSRPHGEDHPAAHGLLEAREPARNAKKKHTAGHMGLWVKSSPPILVYFSGWIGVANLGFDPWPWGDF